MKCAYCKQTIPEIRDANEEPKERTYIVEINGVECEIWMHDECVCKALGEFFSRKPEANHYVTVTPLNEPKTWEPKWTAGSTADCPPPDTTRVWCKADDGSTRMTSSAAYNAEYNNDPHTPWKDRVD